MRQRMIVMGVLLSSHFLITACVSLAETPGERFRKAIKEIEAACAKRKLAPNEVCGEVAKLKPADPLTTEEGRFAHSIKIPNPVPTDSAYKPGMTPQEYFDHLCKTEAGEFIYKTVENVEGIYMMRPRKEATDDELSHLYALEDPYGHENWEANHPARIFVGPKAYIFLEMPLRGNSSRYVLNAGFDGRDPRTMKEEKESKLRSRFGYTWRGMTRPHDRELGIAGSELIVLDLQNNEVLAVRRAYIRSGDMRNKPTGIWWMGGHVCSDSSTRLYRTYEFIKRVLKPVESKEVSDAGK